MLVGRERARNADDYGGSVCRHARSRSQGALFVMVSAESTG